MKHLRLLVEPGLILLITITHYTAAQVNKKMRSMDLVTSAVHHAPVTLLGVTYNSSWHERNSTI